MSEKRFFILTDDEYDIKPCIRDRTFKINDIYGDYKYDDLEEICNEFNRLNDENDRLKEDNKSWMRTVNRMDAIHHEDREYCERVHKEIEQLKQKNDNLIKISAMAQVRNDKLKDENEQLKEKLKEHKTTLKGQSNSIYQLIKKENELLKRRLEEWV